MPSLRLTRRTVDEIPFAESGQVFYRGTMLSGFGLRVLGKHVDRIVGGYVLLSEPDGSGAKKYQVRDVNAKTQGKPDGGTSPF